MIKNCLVCGTELNLRKRRRGGRFANNKLGINRVTCRKECMEIYRKISHHLNGIQRRKRMNYALDEVNER